jgi:hypothetical protein
MLVIPGDRVFLGLGVGVIDEILVVIQNIPKAPRLVLFAVFQKLGAVCRYVIVDQLIPIHRVLFLLLVGSQLVITKDRQKAVQVETELGEGIKLCSFVLLLP